MAANYPKSMSELLRTSKEELPQATDLIKDLNKAAMESKVVSVLFLPCEYRVEKNYGQIVLYGGVVREVGGKSKKFRGNMQKT